MSEEQALSEALLAEAKAGSLLRGIRAQIHSDGLAAVLVSLHNLNQVDVVAAFGELTQSMAAGPSFFVTRHVFEELLPDLNAPVTVSGNHAQRGIWHVGCATFCESGGHPAFARNRPLLIRTQHHHQVDLARPRHRLVISSAHLPDSA